MESGDLVGRVVKACQAAIGAALSNPGQALAIAGGLQSAITTLNLVANEAARGEAGARHVVDNARGLTQGALASVLKYSEGLLDSNGIDVAPALASLAGNTASPEPAPSAPAAASSGRVPLFSEISTAYISVRREGGGGGGLFAEPRQVRPVAVCDGRQVAAAKMTSSGAIEDGIVVVEPGSSINVAFLLTDDQVEKLKIQVLDAQTDAVLYTSPADIPVRLGV